MPPPDGEVSPTAIYACVPALGLHARAEQRAAGQRERAVIVDRRVHHGIRAVDLHLAARDIDIVVGVQTVRACVNVQVAARNVDGVFVAVLTERAAGGIYARRRTLSHQYRRCTR